MKPIKVGQQQQEQLVITVDEPILSGWLTYKGDQRAGFMTADHQGVSRERIVGRPQRTEPALVRQLWDGRLWVAHEGEVIEKDGEIVATRVRFRQVWDRDEKAVIDWRPNASIKIANVADPAAPLASELAAGVEIGHLVRDAQFSGGLS